MLVIEWDEKKLSVGIESIDKQHKTLINLINDIMLSIQGNNQIRDVESFIQKAIDYANYHFEAEENLFEELNINKQDIKKHQKKHQDFGDNINKLFKQIKEDNKARNEFGIEVTTELYRYLTSWLVRHIMEEDKKMFMEK